ncbi:NAD(P)-dependent oxidoreductase [Streptomyces sp. NPDC052109]|uniref:NAD-dependent epimerase/dehydratase family protein n=1 Tax=Streptomyces sp. NPDC052109 TaxID=3155527 RepID=UPI00341C2E0C
MKVLVTGAAGMLGREVVRQLAESGGHVCAHDRVQPDGPPADETFLGDLRDPALIERLVDGMDAVVHAAALPAPTAGTPDEVFTINVNGTWRVLDTAARAGVRRLVYVSSLSALGLAWSRVDRSPTEIPVTEEHPYLAEDVYGLSKRAGELIAETTARRYGGDGMSVLSLRFPFIGSGARLRSHLDWVHQDPGHDRRGLWAWLHTADAARAVLAALDRAPAGYHLVNVTAPDTTALQPTRELLRRYHPDTPVTEVPEGFGTPYSLSRSRDLLGFTAEERWRAAPDSEGTSTP